MQKIAVSLLLAGLLIFSLNSNAHAYDAWDKLGRGVMNIAVSPLELFHGLGDAIKERDLAIGLPVGIFYGAWNTVKRAGVGVYEMITFPIPLPANYEPILEEPMFFGREKEK